MTDSRQEAVQQDEQVGSTPYMAGANAAAAGNGNGNPHALFGDKWHQYEAGYHDGMRLMRRGNEP